MTPTNKIDPYREQNIWNFLFIIAYLLIITAATIWLNFLGRLTRPVPVFDFIVLGLATFRLTHLLVYDHITHFVRHYFDRFPAGPGKTIANLLDCEWCAGIWVAALVLFLYFSGPLAWYAILAVALAGVGTLIEVITQRLIRE